MSAISLAILLEKSTDIESLAHYTCRDKNLLGMQADLLGAYALGLRNLLLTTGDPHQIGDYIDATAVFDVDSIGLTNMVHRLNQGIDVGGKSIGKPTGFLIGVGANPGTIINDRRISSGSHTKSRPEQNSRLPNRFSIHPFSNGSYAALNIAKSLSLSVSCRWPITRWPSS